MEPNQLGMPADPHTGLRPMPPMPTYAQQRTDPYATFNPFQPPPHPQPHHHQPHPHPHPQSQTPTQAHAHAPPHHHHQQPQPQHAPPPPPPPPSNAMSPSVSRKRRASETEPLAGMSQMTSSPGTFSENRYSVPGPVPGSSEVDQTAQGITRKKSRTNTPWTPAEEQRLKSMRDAGQSWGEIAKVSWHCHEFTPQQNPRFFQHNSLIGGLLTGFAHRRFRRVRKEVSRNIITRSVMISELSPKIEYLCIIGYALCRICRR